MHSTKINWNGILSGLAALAVSLSASCSGGASLSSDLHNTSPGSNPVGLSGSNALPGLPMDDTGVAGRSASALEIFPGSSAIDFSNGTVVDTSLVLTSTVDESAWGLYKVEGLAGKKVETVTVQALLSEGLEYSVGISNFSDGVWDFLMGSVSGEFEYDLTADQSRLTSQLGNLYIVVVVADGVAMDLVQLSVDSRPLEDGEELRPAKGRRLSVSEGLPDKIVIQWESVDGALSTELWREADLEGEDESSVLIASIPVEEGKTSYSYEDLDILLGVEYKYSIRAINGTGPGTFSNDESGWAGTVPPIGDDNEHDFEVRGELTVIGEGSITVAAVEFLFDASTIWLGDNDEILSLADFSVGQFVEVDAEQFGTGQWIARTVELEDGLIDEIKVLGLIEEITESSIRVDGTTAATDELTEWLDDNNNPVLPDAFTIGMFAEMEIGADGLGGWLAIKVKMEDGNGEVNDELSILGVIDEITATTITVDGYMATLDELTEWLDDNNDPALPEDFMAGMEVELTADADGLGGWHARKVSMEDLGGGLHEIDVIGEIEFLDASTITVAGQSFNITLDTAWLDGNKNPLTIDDFNVGMAVDVAGEADGLGGWDAVDVEMVN
jgi:hypothetical protein